MKELSRLEQYMIFLELKADNQPILKNNNLMKSPFDLNVFTFEQRADSCSGDTDISRHLLKDSKY
jgi:hypothetical protein